MDSNLEARRPRWYRRRWGIALLALAGALAIAVPVAWATFSDVPPTSPFYADINAIQGAGITAGCGSGNFCPSDSISREAVAAWIHRALPRVAHTETIVDDTIEYSVSPLYPSVTRIASVTITVPGTAGNQFVRLDSYVDELATTGTPPFQVYLYLAESTDCTNTWNGMDTITATNTHLSFPQSWVVVATPGVHTYKLCGFTGAGNVATVSSVKLTAQTVPFGSTGAATLALGSSGEATQARPAP